MKRIYIVIGLVVIAVVVLILVFLRDKDTNEIMVEVKKGVFEVTVSVTGELQAQNSVKISGPSGLRRAGIYGEVKISDIIPEGSVVDSGHYVAALDKSDVLTKLKTVESELQQIEAQFIQQKLDTTLNLRSARDELVNLKFSLEEKKITFEQSKFEPPATIRQNKIEMEKAERTYKQSLMNYKLKKKKAEAEVMEIAASMTQKRYVKENLVSLLDEFDIHAPQQGMVIYHKTWRGKVKSGSNLGWDNIVATLPDLSSMISKTYVNEIDIRKIKVGQEVKLGVDAFPEKEYQGIVYEVANIGEQLPNSNSKVFEVQIKVKQSDSILRPAMTTSNVIVTDTFHNVLFVPLEAINTSDSINYVYKAGGIRIQKQVVITGTSNDDEIIIKKGLSEGDKVLLTVPENADKLEFTGLDLLEPSKGNAERP